MAHPLRPLLRSSGARRRTAPAAARGLLTAAAALLLTAGCDTPSAVVPGDAPLDSRSAQPARAHGDLLKAVRQETARFNATAQALRAGYAPDDHCVAHPTLGGMGYHWVNMGLIDPVFDPMKPEALLYSTGEGGNLRLRGVEYIVIDIGQEHPHFDGHPLDVGGVPPLMEAGVPHWSLHVWVHLDNPSGTFAPFNPNVACP
jgi:hypothetical protein